MDTLFLVAMIVEGLVALAAMFVPAARVLPPGEPVNLTPLLLTRLLGAALISFPVLLWFARKSTDMGFKRGAAYTLSTYYLVSILLLLVVQLTVAMDPVVWGVIVIHGGLLLWFVYYLRK